MLPKWQNLQKKTPFDRERDSHWSYIEEKSHSFGARSTLANNIVHAICEGQRRIAIKGNSGSGKSTLFCQVANTLKEKGMCVIPFISGLTADSSTSIGILRQLVYCLEEHLGQAHIQDMTVTRELKSLDYHETTEFRNRLSELCQSLRDINRPLVIMVDAVDHLHLPQ